MPEWAEDDPGAYWEAADEHERANGRLYSEVQFALPKEFGEAERRELAVEFAERVCSQERLSYTLAIHRGGANRENPHAHLMFSERGHDGIERSAEQWFRRYNRKAQEKGGGAASETVQQARRVERRNRAGEHEREADRKQVERLEREIAGVEARLKETYDRVRTAWTGWTTGPPSPRASGDTVPGSSWPPPPPYSFFF